MMVCIWAEIKRYNDFQEEYKEKQERDKRRKQQREKEIQTMWDHIKEMEQEMMERNLKMQQDPMNICKILDEENNKEIEIPRELLEDPDKLKIIKYIEEELNEGTTKKDGQ